MMNAKTTAKTNTTESLSIDTVSFLSHEGSTDPCNTLSDSFRCRAVRYRLMSICEPAIFHGGGGIASTPAHENDALLQRHTPEKFGFNIDTYLRMGDIFYSGNRPRVVRVSIVLPWQKNECGV
mmetsp:Transcript_5561/g.11833  ORF Transcript_5561/g.11833 Transcript_5561/m.11833 type:complete len:123 (+) Transcript_5561:339-707(+)